MSDQSDDAIIQHLMKQEHWLARLLSGSITLDQKDFATNPGFGTFRHIEQINTITHFDYESEWDDGDDDSEGNDGEHQLTIRYVHEFKKVRSSIPFVLLSGDTGFLILTPARFWSHRGSLYSAGETKEILIGNFYYEEKVEEPRESDEVIMETWRYSTKTGERDWRHKDNWSQYLVRRHGITLLLPDQSEWQLGGLSKEDSEQLFTTLLKITQGAVLQQDDALDETEDEQDEDYDYEENEDIEGEEYKEPWHEVLGVSPDATANEIKAAYRERIKQYHPDRVSGLGEKLRALAEVESQKLNAAKEEGLARY